MGTTLFARAATYAREEGLEVRVLPRQANACAVIYGPAVAVIFVDAATAHGPQCGEVIYSACEAYRKSRATEFTVAARPIPPELRTPA